MPARPVIHPIRRKSITPRRLTHVLTNTPSIQPNLTAENPFPAISIHVWSLFQLDSLSVSVLVSGLIVSCNYNNIIRLLVNNDWLKCFQTEWVIQSLFDIQTAIDNRYKLFSYFILLTLSSFSFILNLKFNQRWLTLSVNINLWSGSSMPW